MMMIFINHIHICWILLTEVWYFVPGDGGPSSNRKKADAVCIQLLCTLSTSITDSISTVLGKSLNVLVQFGSVWFVSISLC